MQFRAVLMGGKKSKKESRAKDTEEDRPGGHLIMIAEGGNVACSIVKASCRVA